MIFHFAEANPGELSVAGSNSDLLNHWKIFKSMKFIIATLLPFILKYTGWRAS